MPKPAKTANQTNSERANAPFSPCAAQSDKATEVVINFLETIFHEGAHNWSPEEREQRINACLTESSSYRAAKDRQDLDALSQNLRKQIEMGEFSPSPLNEDSAPKTPPRPHDMRQAITKLTETIQFD